MNIDRYPLSSTILVNIIHNVYLTLDLCRLTGLIENYKRRVEYEGQDTGLIYLLQVTVPSWLSLLPSFFQGMYFHTGSEKMEALTEILMYLKGESKTRVGN